MLARHSSGRSRLLAAQTFDPVVRCTNLPSQPSKIERCRPVSQPTTTSRRLSVPTSRPHVPLRLHVQTPGLEASVAGRGRCRRRRPSPALLAPVLLALVLLAAGACKPTPKVYRVGILSGLDFFASTADGFKAGMRDLGYVEGVTIHYDVRKTNFAPQAEEEILREFVAGAVDLVLVFPTEPSVLAKRLTAGAGIPVVFANANIEDTGLVASVREPGGNITGVRYPGPSIAVRRYEILRELAPDARRLWVPYQRGYPSVESQLAVLRRAAAADGVTLVECAAGSVADLGADLDARARSADPGVDAILLVSEPLAVTPVAFERIGRFAAAHRLAIGGALMSAGGFSSVFGASTDNVAVGRQAAPLADKIFRGVRAGTIPVASAEAMIEIDHGQATRLGLKVPEGLLRQARRVVR
jgi:putative tryptophan/tyrosine transport system substrate-binding protein